MTIPRKTFGFIALIFLFGFILRIPYFFHVMQDIDEGCHAAIAAVLMEGGLPYADAVDNKPPGILFIYLITFLIFGKYNMIAVHGVTFLWTIVTACILGVLARKLGGRGAALFAMLFYLTFTASLYPKMIAANTEIFMALPYTLAVLLLWYGCEHEKWLLFALAGFMAGLAPLFKQVGAIESVAVAAYLLFVIPLLYGRNKFQSSLKASIQFGIGYLLPICGVVVYFYQKGILSDFIFWTLEFPRRYISQGASNLGFLSQIFAEFVPFVLSTIILWVLAIIWIKREFGSLRAQKSSFSSPFSLFLILWLIASVSVTLLGSRMFGHYFIQILPSLCLMAAIPAGKYVQNSRDSRSRYWRNAILALTVLPGVIFTGMAISFEAATDTWGEIKPDFRPATEYIKAHTNPKDRIFVWGWFTPVYVYSERTPSSRFVYATLQTGYKRGYDPDEADRGDLAWVSVPETWSMLATDLKQNPPELIIDTSPGNYHYFGRYGLQNYPVMKSYVERQCRLEKSIAGMTIYRCRADLVHPF
jgi:4-amino-4-deoxy-L-arabinose transferase-like glycosyltransferase